MPSIWKIRRDWSLLHFEICTDRIEPPQNLEDLERLELSIQRVWRTLIFFDQCYFGHLQFS